MSTIGDNDENATTPNCPTCGDTTPRGVVCLTCQPFPELHRCQICERRGPRPVEVSEPFPLPIPVTTLNFDASYTPDVGTTGRYGRWMTYHDGSVCEITHGETLVRCVFHHDGLGRSERESILPKLVAAIEGVIDATEGG